MPRRHLYSFVPAGLLALALVSPPAGAASFNCAKAATAVEKQVCAEPELSELDEYLGRYYEGARQGLVGGEACLAADQRQWLRGERDACRDAACLKQAYLRRLAVLDAVQPGVTRLRQRELPREKPLVAIVPPAADTVAAPRGRPSVPLQVQGRLLGPAAGAPDGWSIKADAGRLHVLVPDMLVAGATQDALASLSAGPGGRFEARGRAEPGNPLNFSSAHCTYLYRTAP